MCNFHGRETINDTEILDYIEKNVIDVLDCKKEMPANCRWLVCARNGGGVLNYKDKNTSTYGGATFRQAVINAKNKYIEEGLT